MSIILVEHEAGEPALYGMMAAVAARARGAGFAHLPARFDADYPDAVQHVTRDGHLVPSGLVWIERLCDIPVGAAAHLRDLVEAACGRDIVVPHHPRLAEPGVFDALRKAARATNLPVETAVVSRKDDGYRLLGAGLDEVWSRDCFGRPVPADAALPARPDEAALTVALVGSERDHRDVYPAVLAALGDAAYAAAIPVAIRFVPPRAFMSGDPSGLLAGVAGVVLPGGSEMANVAGQIDAASAAIRRRIPVVGLCLGMQTVATAVARSLPGLDGANLAEADAEAPVKTFVPMAEDHSLVPHRLGEVELTTVAGSRLAAILGARHRLRVNHCFRLDPALVPVLSRAGLAITGRDSTGTIADGLELAGHPFCLALQGHPELSSRPSAPHPLMRAFVDTLAAHRTGLALASFKAETCSVAGSTGRGRA